MLKQGPPPYALLNDSAVEQESGILGLAPENGNHLD
jgi:hypothetical protein